MTALGGPAGWTGRADVASYGGRVREFVAQAWIAPPSPAAANELLTGGCGLALAIEALCGRLEREIAELAPAAEDPEVARRLRRLPPELARAKRQLETVRTAIVELRRHVGVARPSAP